MSKISVIIPVYNEERLIGNLLGYIFAHSSNYNIQEVIVVDGQSTDGTTTVVENFISDAKYSIHLHNLDEVRATVKLISSEKGRSKQMNAAAHVATAEILYFLHSDCFPPKYFDQYIVNAYKKDQFSGCFKMKFDYEHWWLRLAGWFTRFNWKMCRGGDQSLFVSKTLFNKVGGYDENYTIYEDNVLIDKLYKIDKFTVIQQPLTSSARAYKKHGVWKLQYHFWTIHLKKRLGATPDDMYQYYQKHILKS